MAGNPTIQTLTLVEQGIALRESDPEKAKDLLSQALRFLEGEERQDATVHLAIAYYWTGEYSEGLALIDDLLGHGLKDPIRCRALLAKASLQLTSPQVSLDTLNEAERCCAGAGPAFLGMWHNQRARAFKALRQYDKASIDYAGAAAFFDEAGDIRRGAIALNNYAAALLMWGKHEDAHEASRRAVASLSADDPVLANFQDQLAQILVAQGKAEEARQLIDKVINSVNGDRRELLLECLLTRASALIQLKLAGHAFQDVDRAQEISDYLGRDDLRLTVAKARKDLAASFSTQSYIQLVELALEQSGGNIRAAAEKIGRSHTSLMDFIRVHKLERKPARLKSIILKT